MKNKINKSGMCAAAITLILGTLNYILGHVCGKIIGITSWGGDVKQTYGFGVVLTKHYPEHSINDPSSGTTIVGTSVPLFLVSILALWIVLFMCFLIIDKIKAKKVSKENV